jgi:hypothetical protein
MPYERTEVVQPSGIVSDISPFEMPADVWSGGDNINFRRGRTNALYANNNPYPDITLAVSPTYMQYVDINGVSNWIYCSYTGSINIVELTDGSTITSPEANGLTRDPPDPTYVYNNSRIASWSGCNFNSLVVLNNRLNTPQILEKPYNVIKDMPFWDAATAPWDAGSTCEVIRPYKNYLIAMDCYDNVRTRYANMVRWSSPAILGEAPTSWDADAVGEQAGLYPLADTPGRVVDGLTLGDYFVIYKTDAVWLMQFIGGEFTMSFRKLFGGDAGILSKDCVVEFQGKHFVLSPSSCYVHNGNTKEDVMDGWVKDEFFQTVHEDYIESTKVVADHNNNEVIIYFISNSNTATEPYADRALVWDWATQEWSRRELNQISHIAEGYISPTVPSQTWDDDSQDWDNDTTTWDGDVNFSPVFESLLMGGYETQEFYASEYTRGVNVFYPEGWVERIGIDFNNDRRFKMLERIVPHIDSAEEVTITIYASDIPDLIPTPQQIVTFDPKVDVDVDVHVVGRYLGIKFSCPGFFRINGYTLEWKPTGSF